MTSIIDKNENNYDFNDKFNLLFLKFTNLIVENINYLNELTNNSDKELKASKFYIKCNFYDLSKMLPFIINVYNYELLSNEANLNFELYLENMYYINKTYTPPLNLKINVFKYLYKNKLIFDEDVDNNSLSIIKEKNNSIFDNFQTIVKFKKLEYLNYNLLSNDKKIEVNNFIKSNYCKNLDTFYGLMKNSMIDISKYTIEKQNSRDDKLIFNRKSDYFFNSEKIINFIRFIDTCCDNNYITYVNPYNSNPNFNNQICNFKISLENNLINDITKIDNNEYTKIISYNNVYTYLSIYINNILLLMNISCNDSELKNKIYNNCCNLILSIIFELDILKLDNVIDQLLLNNPNIFHLLKKLYVNNNYYDDSINNENSIKHFIKNNKEKIINHINTNTLNDINERLINNFDSELFNYFSILQKSKRMVLTKNPKDIDFSKSESLKKLLNEDIYNALSSINDILKSNKDRVNNKLLLASNYKSFDIKSFKFIPCIFNSSQSFENKDITNIMFKLFKLKIDFIENIVFFTINSSNYNINKLNYTYNNLKLIYETLYNDDNKNELINSFDNYLEVVKDSNLHFNFKLKNINI